MNGKMDEFDAVDAVDQRALRAYVESRGWQKGEPFGDLGSSYTYGNGDIEVFVPTSRRLADFAIRTWETAGTIAEVEDRARSAVLRDLLLSDVDKIQIRVSETGTGGSLPIETGVRMVQQSRDMLLAAACSALKPQRAFRAGGVKGATEYLASARLGHTERGSFAINLLSPLPVEPQQSLSPELAPEPFPRKAVRKLVSGLDAAREAVDLADGAPAFKLLEARVQRGVSANLCGAIGEMVGNGDVGEIDISVIWALDAPNSEEPSRSVKFTEADAPTLRESSQILKERQERQDERIEGYVFSLARNKSAHKGRVKIKGVIDGSMKSIRADFSPEEYSRVADAHKGRRTIALTGDLRREGQQWVLDNPRGLTVYDDED